MSSTFSGMTSLGCKVSMLGTDLSIKQVTETECNTNIRDLRSDTTSSVEDSVVSSTGKRLLLKRRQDVSNDTLIINEKSSVSLVSMFRSLCKSTYSLGRSTHMTPPILYMFSINYCKGILRNIYHPIYFFPPAAPILM